MDRGNSKHGPHLDEQMAEEVRGYVQGGAPTRAEEWKDPEPPGEDQPDILMDPDLERAGTPPGMNPQDVEGRYELARYLRYTGFPADRDALLEMAQSTQAPERIRDDLARLPKGREFTNVTEVWEALGHGVEERRT